MDSESNKKQTTHIYNHIMKKTLLISAAALMAATAVAQDAVPAAGIVRKGAAPFRKAAKAPEYRDNTFEESFEGRGDELDWIYYAANNWLPQGWKDESKVGNLPITSSEENRSRHDLTWRTFVKNGSFFPHTGSCFAYIEPDAAYGDYIDLKEQDEWLYTPEMAVQEQDVFYFYLAYSPYLTLRNRDKGDFSACNNILEVYGSTDDGESWEMLWSSYDDAKTFTEEELMDYAWSLSFADRYRPIFVDIPQYEGKTARFAFRYHGKTGSPMAIDDVTLGIPRPTACYDLPSGIFFPAITEATDFPSDPRMLAPDGVEFTWNNTSTYAKGYEWNYAGIDGADAVTGDMHLVTPAYPRSSVVATPSLTCSYGTNISDPYSVSAPYMQFGGMLPSELDAAGNEIRTGAANYNYLDPESRIRFSRFIGFYADTDNNWEALTGTEIHDWDWATCIGTMYEQPAAAYGLQYVYFNALVSQMDPSTVLTCNVYRIDGETGELLELVTKSSIDGKDITVDPDNFTSFRIDFPKPLTIDYPIFVELTGFNKKTDDVRFATMFTTNPLFTGASFMGFNQYTSLTDEFYMVYADLSMYPIGDNGSHAAGVLMGLGASFSWMEVAVGETSFNMGSEGGSHELYVEAFHAPDAWMLYENGGPCKWAGFEAEETETPGIYKVTVNVNANNSVNERKRTLELVSPGSSLELKVNQDKSLGVAGVDVSEVETEYFNLQGIRVENPVKGGLYIMRKGGKATKQILR